MGKLKSPFIGMTSRKLTAAGLRNSSAKQVPVGAVIMSTRAPIGHLSIPENPMAFNQGCRGLVPDARLDTKFLYYFLWFSREKLNELGTGATFKELASSVLGNFEIPLPPLEEQRRIVAVLDEAFAAIATATANAKKNLANARELFEAILASAFNKVDETWQSRPFESCLKRLKYPAKIQRKAFKKNGKFPIISQESDFINGYWDYPEDVLLVEKPLIVFGDHTQILKYIDFDFVLGADGVKLLLPESFLDTKYLLYFLKANPMPAKGYARHYRHLKSLDVYFPVIDQQRRIASKIENFETIIEQLEQMQERREENLTALKQSFLHCAFAGEITLAAPPKIAA